MIAQSELAAQVGGPGFFRNKRVGTRFNQASVNLFRAQDATQTRRSLVKNILEIGTGPPKFLKSESSGEAGDASAEDGDAFHELRLPASGFRLPEEREPDAEYSCTKRARFFTFSTGVSGKMP